MNTSRQINMMVIVLFLLLIGIGVYALYEPYRSDTAEGDQMAVSIERGAHLFALNCRVCHGDVGQGGAAGGRLPAAPPLDNPQLRGFDRLGVNFDQAQLDEDVLLVRNTISCGRAGTAMPTWGQEHGGTLNTEQINQLTRFITRDDFWELAQEEANEADGEATLHATLQMPGGALSATDDELIVSDAGPFNQDQAIRIGEGATEERLRVLEVPSTGHLLAQEIGREPTIFQVTGVQARDAHIQVERGIQDTLGALHASGDEIFFPPEDPDAEGEEAQPTPTGSTLLEGTLESSEDLVVSSTLRLRVGQVIIIGAERMRITGVEKAQTDIGEGDMVRVERELMRVNSIGDDGATDVVLVGDISSAMTTIDVSDAGRLQRQGVIRVDDELLRVVEAVSTGRTLREGIGRAEDEFVVSGLNSIEEGMIIRLEGDQRFTSELMRVEEKIEAVVKVTRGGTDDDPIETGAHSAGSDIDAIVEVPVEGGEEGETEQVAEDTGQTLVEPIDDEDDTLVISGTEGITIDGTIVIDGEEMIVTEVEQARLKVERGAEDTAPLTHASGIPIFDGNLLDVERGYVGTSGASHDNGADIFRFVLDVQRAVEGSVLADHAANSELFLGNNGLIVQRGILNTTPSEHENGEVVYNFPEAPDSTTPNPGACGQSSGTTQDTGPTPTQDPAAQQLTIQAVEGLAFSTDTLNASSSIPVTRVVFDNTEDGLNHNFALLEEEGGAPIVGGLGPECVGPCENYVQFETPDPGEYYFQCDVHPGQMFGDFIVEEGAAAPAASPTPP